MPSTLLLFLVLPLVHAAVPPTWKRCSLKSPEKDVCLEKAIQRAVNDLVKAPEVFGMKKIDPLFIPVVKLIQTTGPVEINAVTYNVTYKNFFPVTIFDVKHFKNHTLVFHAKCQNKRVEMWGFYDMKGNILNFPISGSGDAEIIYDDLIYRIQIDIGRKLLNGREVYEANRCMAYLRPSRMTYDMKNLFENKDTGEKFNKFVSNNWEVILKATYSTMAASIGEGLKQVINPILNSISTDEIDL